MLPLYEAKMLHLYDTRWATYDPDGSTRAMTEDEKSRFEAPIPQYWVAESKVAEKVPNSWEFPWFLGWRDIARATDARTFISTKVPRVAIGNKIPLMLPSTSADGINALQASIASFACDYVARQKLGGASMNYFVLKQLAVPSPQVLSAHHKWLEQVRLSRLVERLNGWIPSPTERSRVRAELDALVFHIYGLERDEVSYVLDTFPIVKRKDEAEFGSYRTKELILAVYDSLALAKESGQLYQAPWNVEVTS